MKGKRLLAGLLAVSLLPISALVVSAVEGIAEKQLQVPVEKTLAKSELGNPFLGFDENGDLLYAGDPSIMVDGDTVYAYVGNDAASGEYYWMPNWRCYSSTDMIHWKYESIILENSAVSWAANDHEAWAAQVIKYKDKYYFYFTTEGSSSVGGGKCIGVAVSDSPTGPFKDVGYPLVRNTDTQTAQMDGYTVGSAHTWEDIDPTAWIETDPVTGEDRRILSWGNNRLFSCELNEDMVSIKNRDGNASVLSLGQGSGYDIALGTIDGAAGAEAPFYDENGTAHFFTEAPYYYRQQDEEGNYYGKYYLFFATDWREQMAYATADTYEQFLDNEWDFGGVIMIPTASANTNHMAVFDFKGETYFVYHNGTLPRGSGYRRVACVEKLEINADGSIDLFEETSTGISGVTSKITDSNGVAIAHEAWVNTLSDSDYVPQISNPLRDVFVSNSATEKDSTWEIKPGKCDKTNPAYVSIQSYNKPGLYITVEGNEVVLCLDWDANTTSATKATWRTLEGFAGYGVTFESVYKPGYYLASVNGELVLQSNPTAEACTFNVDTDTEVSSVKVQKTKRMYTVGSELNTNDIRVEASYANGDTNWVTEFTTNAASIDMNTTGKKTLTVTYVEDGVTVTEDVTITVVNPGTTK